jgi:hypothetical protein
MATADEVTLAATDDVLVDLDFITERRRAGELEGSQDIDQHNRFQGRSMAVFTVSFWFLL